jgi:hypothetical protein
MSANSLYYTNRTPIPSITVSNNYYQMGGVLATNTSVALPGLLILVTNNTQFVNLGPASNIGSVTNSSGQVYAKFVTNDFNNMFQDVPLNGDETLSMQPMLGGTQPTNGMGTITFYTAANGTSGTGSNVVTYAFAPVWDGGPNCETLQSYWLTGSFTNTGAVIAPGGTVTSYFPQNAYTIQVPSSKFLGCKAIRCVSLTAGASTYAIWILDVKYNAWRP